MGRLKPDIDGDVELFNIQGLEADEKRRQHIIQRMKEYQHTVMCQQKTPCVHWGTVLLIVGPV